MPAKTRERDNFAIKYLDPFCLGQIEKSNLLDSLNLFEQVRESVLLFLHAQSFVLKTVAASGGGDYKIQFVILHCVTALATKINSSSEPQC